MRAANPPPVARTGLAASRGRDDSYKRARNVKTKAQRDSEADEICRGVMKLLSAIAVRLEVSIPPSVRLPITQPTQTTFSEET